MEPIYVYYKNGQTKNFSQIGLFKNIEISTEDKGFIEDIFDSFAKKLGLNTNA